MRNINFVKLLELKLTLILSLSLAGAIVYRLYALNTLGLVLSLLLFGLFTFILTHFGLDFNIWQNTELKLASTKTSLDRTIITIFILFSAINIFELLINSTAKSIISPWEVVPGWFFWIFSLNLALGIYLIHYLGRRWPIWLLFAQALLVIPLAYKIGYGYDFFIHGASLKLIDETGLILPKTNFYLGQYSLLIIFHKLTHIPLYWTHKFLVPLFTVTFLPYFTLKFLKTQTYSTATSIALLAIPFSFLTFTTPQNFGYLLLLILTLNLASATNRQDLLLNTSLVLAGLTIHPITGIPSLLLFILYYLPVSSSGYLKSLILVITPLILPALYFLTSAGAHLSWPDLQALVSTTAYTIPYQFNFILNTVYLFGFNQIVLISCLTALGAWVSHQQSDTKFKTNFYLALGFLLSSLAMSSISNNGLINYEQTDYAERLHVVALILSLPLILTALNFFYQRTAQEKTAIKLSWLLFSIVVITSNVYLSYPRNDNYFNSRGLSTSQSDLKAVSWINDHAQGDFIVLANQQVSAGALHLYGFKKYYQNNIFYYPVPTSGPLYEYYLKMVYDTPSAANMQAAMRLAGVSHGYFILNKYWTDFPKILEEAKLTAKSYQSFDNGEDYVFEY